MSRFTPDAEIFRDRATPLVPLTARPDLIARGLWTIAALVFLIVVVGGITRITESGLSITEWKPVSGAIPPLNDADWHAQFDLYKQTAQYQTVNQNMTLSDFKFIFFWEWVHRLIGRLIGVAFAVPFAWFAWKKMIPDGYGPRLIGLFILGGLQGVIGWWMVTSGLVGRTEVSHYRLAIHLMNAFLILAVTVWTALDMHALVKGQAGKRMPTGFGWLALGMLTVQLTWGAFVAGLRAGHVSADWPKMNPAEWYPAGVQYIEPAWRNIIDNPFVTHFFHRWFAWAVAVVLVMLAIKAMRQGGRSAAIGLKVALVAQVLLGIFTVLSGVELWIAVTHQGVAAILLMYAVGAAHVIGKSKVEPTGS